MRKEEELEPAAAVSRAYVEEAELSDEELLGEATLAKLAPKTIIITSDEDIPAVTEELEIEEELEEVEEEEELEEVEELEEFEEFEEAAEENEE
jgi:hypothetical protein